MSPKQETSEGRVDLRTVTEDATERLKKTVEVLPKMDSTLFIQTARMLSESLDRIMQWGPGRDYDVSLCYFKVRELIDCWERMLEKMDEFPEMRDQLMKSPSTLHWIIYFAELSANYNAEFDKLFW